MTTKNLADNSPLVQAAIAEMQAIEERAAVVAKLAEENEKKRQETESQRDKALKALEISARRVKQQAQDNLAEIEEEKDVIEEEAGQLVYILEGNSDDEPVAPAPDPDPEPTPPDPDPEPATVVEPEPRVIVIAPDPEPAPAPVEEEPETDEVRVTVIDRANPRNWGWISWVLAIIFALIAYKIGDSFYEDVENNVKQVLLWLAYKPALTFVGFFSGGLIGTLIQARLDRRRTTVVVA